MRLLIVIALLHLHIYNAKAQNVKIGSDSIPILLRSNYGIDFLNRYAQLDSLLNEKLYDAVIDTCRQHISTIHFTNEGRIYYEYLAITYALMSRMDSARNVALEFLNGKSMGDFDAYDIMLFFDYNKSFSLASDDILWNQSIQLLSTDYTRKGYPITDVGLKLLLLYASFLRDVNYYNYLKDNATDSTGIEFAENFKNRSCFYC